MRSQSVCRLAGAVVLAVLAAAGMTGCARQVDGPSLVLRLATPDRQSDPTGQQVVQFAEEVSRRSGGSIEIDPVWDVTLDGAHDWDQTVARGVADAMWDMGLVPGRAWDALGVDSLRALNTPFLITSEAGLQAVLDSDLREDLLAGLPAAGVTGLDVFPDDLRHPFGFDRALLGAEDYVGQTIRAPTSETDRAVFAALGATTSDDDPDSRTQRGDESSYSLAQGNIATGNVTFYPKADTLVLRSAVRHRLRDDQWSLLIEAASATRTWLFAHSPSEEQLAAAFCAQGGVIVSATEAQLSGLKQAVAPLVENLHRDNGTGELIDAIGHLVAGVPAVPSPTSCPARVVPSSADEQLRDLDGTYVTTVTEKQLKDAGDLNPVQVRENSGDFTWVLDGGRWSYHQVATFYIARPDDSGRYTYSDGVFTLYWSAAPGDWSRARLEMESDGNIRFHDVVEGQPDKQTLGSGFFREWTRVGGPR